MASSTAALVVASTDEEPAAPCGSCGVRLGLLTPRLACRADSCRGVVICIQCFARGSEFGQHRNYHPYAVFDAQLPLLSWDWSGADEVRLLEAIETCGLGNWSDVAKIVGGGKTANDCRAHYARYYIYGNYLTATIACNLKTNRVFKLDEINTGENAADSYLGTSSVTYTSTIGRAPRPELGSVGQSEDFAGYFPARGDFFDEIDPQAEALLASVSFRADDSKGEGLDDIDHEAQMALVEGYRRRIIARERVKDVVAQHGLLSRAQNTEWESRYFRDLGEITVRSLLPMVNILSPDDMLAFFESLALAEQLKRRVCRLHDARSNGLKTQREITQFERLNQLRQRSYTKPSQCKEVLRSSKDANSLRRLLLRRQRDTAVEASASMVGMGKTNRRPKKPPPSPLTIEHLQGFFKLSQAEREFCSNSRLFPSTYLGLKSQLVSECQRNDGLRLSRARTLCNIDVNKTKRLYHFLLSQELIHE